jgi:hypothetical protein
MICGQKDSVAGTAIFQATSHSLHLDLESAMAQALLEFSIILGRPDSQHPLHLESRAGGGYSAVVIEPGVARGGKCGRAVVYVE